MVRTIQLNRDGIGRLSDKEPFLLPDEIKIKLVSKEYFMQNAFITLYNRVKRRTYKYESEFTLPEEFKTAGLLNIRVELFEGETKVKNWDIVPIKIVEVSSGYEMKDYLGELEEKLAELQEKVSVLEKQHEIIK